MSALDGRRIVVTRAAEQAESLIQMLLELGAEPLAVPLIQIVDPSDGGAALRDALSRLADFDWVVVTSPNGASRVRPALAAASARPRLAAVGSATEAVLGFRADLVPVVQTAEGLAAEFADDAGSVLLIQPERVRPRPTATEPVEDEQLMNEEWTSPIHRALLAKRCTVTPVGAYRTIPVAPSSGDLLKVLSADAVLFASGSAVRAWTDVFGTQTPAIAAAIGPSTAQVAANLGLKVDVIAADHSLHGLVDSLVAYFTDDV